jgi:hypothetical protein
VFDSEKSNVHNKLLKQIQEGVKLKSVKTNDRSKPVLEGLRKFRRQLTIEEQIQKAEQAPVEEDVTDDMDDIDAVRDDLQSTKQMLALELRNKEALVRENKRLQVVIIIIIIYIYIYIYIRIAIYILLHNTSYIKIFKNLLSKYKCTVQVM